ncbi:sulfatase-like hydrolase/transferase [Cupriavidus sp. UYPR2.512]|uniref:sulfatase-like hydrolase/transferase n=1 Tax=Cupriavidus sp. UYPR2.512 TaxID=1080187 RepID=UPI001E33F8DC|nr:sulfatase-like hydrolase/transferase [Cupriavidus sp. UYPR2.512]
MERRSNGTGLAMGIQAQLPELAAKTEARKGRDTCRRALHAIAALALTVPLSQVQAAPDTGRDSRPNIILLIADDLGWGDLGSYGHPVFRTPNLDRMAAEGQRWTNFYVSSPVCSPSRGAMLTGRAEIRSGLYGALNSVQVEGDPYGFPDRETTVASLLRDAGYATALFGKWHLGDAPRAYPTRHGFDSWWGMPMSNDAYFAGFPGGVSIKELRQRFARGESPKTLYPLYYRQAVAAFRDPKNSYWNSPLIASEQVVVNGKTDYRDQVVERPVDQPSYNKRLTDQVVDYIGRKRDKPFLAWVGYEKPHLPHMPAPEFVGSSKGGPVGDAIAELDHSVGRVLEAVRRSPDAKNTLVVFVSDNGPWILYEEMVGSAGMLRDGKASTYEGGSRVPALFWWPGTVRPRVVDGIGATYDFLPTFVALAKARLPDAVIDGSDLSKTLRDQSPSPRQVLPYFYRGRLQAWREGDWKVNFYDVSGRNPEGGLQARLAKPTLYNLGRDPGEKFDKAEIEPAILQRLQHDAEAFERSFLKAAPEFDRVTLEHGPAGRRGE